LRVARTTPVQGERFEAPPESLSSAEIFRLRGAAILTSNEKLL
jgi:hypothetical protein